VTRLAVIILACGKSKRFVGYDVPKQFLSFKSPQIGGREMQMWQHTVDGVTTNADFYIAMLNEHVHKNIRVASPFHINVLNMSPTRGQADTLFQAVSQIKSFSPKPRGVLVLNCDQGFAPGVLESFITLGHLEGMPAALTFKAPASEAHRWSYVDNHPFFYAAKERKAASEHAMAGAYFFPSLTELYVAAQDVCMWAPTGHEPYVSEIFGYIPGTKRSIEMRREDWYDWGTPETFEDFKKGCQ
jgi:molybdopterin-guanine dinucleotide biosynthesis protein A